MSKICTECNTVNEDKYEYCVNCGTKLSGSESKDEPVYTRTVYKKKLDMPDTVDGVSMSDLSVFVDKNTEKILPKFATMELTKSKVSFCWPVAVLSFLFGPFGAAIWAFYRKMYKIGLIFMLIGVLTYTATCALRTTSSVKSEAISEIIENYIDTAELDANKIAETFKDKDFLKISLASAVSNAVTLLTVILGGIFAFYFYKNFAVGKIKQYDSIPKDERYRPFGLRAIGSTSGGMATLAVFLMIFLENGIEMLLKFVAV